MYINDLPELVETSVCKSFLFADDVMLLFRTALDNVDVLQSNLDYSVSRFLQWSCDNGLTVNNTKTKAILFGNIEIPLRIIINGSSINFDERLECLGIYIDRSLLLYPTPP